MNIILIILIIMFCILIAILFSRKSIESFGDCKNCYQIIDCNDPKEKDKKCQYRFRGSWIKCPKGTLNEDQICYDCPWKRPGLDLLPDTGCCDKKCCRREKKDLGVPYYCRRYGTCIKKYSKDGKCKSCGMQTLYNIPAKIFDTLEACRNYINPYAKLNKEECLKQTSAGWCTDYLGNGVCVPGTPEGPIDQLRWDTCYVNQRTDKNSWQGGQPIPKGELKLIKKQ